MITTTHNGDLITYGPGFHTVIRARPTKSGFVFEDTIYMTSPPIERQPMTTLRQTITIDDAVTLLNDMLAADIAATAALLANRVPCNQALADHRSIQVDDQHGAFFVGMLGVINGLFGVTDEGRGAIAYVFEDDETNGKRRLVRFERTV